MHLGCIKGAFRVCLGCIQGAFRVHLSVKVRACLITLHSNFEIFQKGNPAVEIMLDRRIFER